MKCGALTRRKNQCTHNVIDGEEYCNIHFRRMGKIDCVVCTNPIRKNPRLACGHEIHRKCIMRDAVAQNRKVAQCPVCRRELPEIWRNQHWRPSVYPPNLYETNINNTSPDDSRFTFAFASSEHPIPIFFEGPNITGTYNPLSQMITSSGDVPDLSVLSNTLDVLREYNISSS